MDIDIRQQDRPRTSRPASIKPSTIPTRME